jgi:hypothetical protein
VWNRYRCVSGARGQRGKTVENDKGEKGSQTYGLGGLGSRSTFLMVKISSFGSPQKYSGLSPGTLYSSLIVTWSAPSQEPEGEAETVSALAAARRRVVSCIVAVWASWSRVYKLKNEAVGWRDKSCRGNYN